MALGAFLHTGLVLFFSGLVPLLRALFVARLTKSSDVVNNCKATFTERNNMVVVSWGKPDRFWPCGSVGVAGFTPTE